jgi:hypothetical protein
VNGGGCSGRHRQPADHVHTSKFRDKYMASQKHWDGAFGCWDHSGQAATLQHRLTPKMLCQVIPEGLQLLLLSSFGAANCCGCCMLHCS